MRYQGGKTKIAPQIVEVIEHYRVRESLTRYVEPFLGGASIFAEAAYRFPEAYGSDVMEDLAMLWEAAYGGWQAPTTISEEDWYAWKADPVPSATRAFVAHACSFAGKRWGGYARDPKGGANFAASGSRSVERKAAGMRRGTGSVYFLSGDYRELDYLVGAGTLVYCDPPYAGTLAYRDADAFDHDLFWKTLDSWVDRRARVLVSEYTAPDHWECVRSIERHVSTALDNRDARAVDRVFTRTA